MTDDTARLRLIYIPIALLAATYSLLQSLLLPALPTLAQDFHTSIANIDWLFTGYLITSATATATMGRVGDLFGKKRALLAILVVFAAATLVSAISTTYAPLLISRTVQGVSGGVLPLVFGIIRDEFPATRVASGFGAVAATLGVGTGIGLMVAGPIVSNLDYHWLFWTPLILIVLTGLASALLIPKSPVHATGGINYLGALLLSGWLTTFLVAISEAPLWGWTSARVLGLLGCTVILVAAWIRCESRAEYPLIDLKLLRVPAVAKMNSAAFLLGPGMFVVFIDLPEFVRTPAHDGYGFGSSTTGAGLFLLPATICMLLGGTFSGVLSRWFGSRRLVIAAGFISAFAYVFGGFANSQAWEIYLFTALAGTGISMAFAPIMNLLFESIPADQTGAASGMNTNFRNIGSALGVAVTTSILASGLGKNSTPPLRDFAISFVAVAATQVAISFLAISLPSRRAAAKNLIQDSGSAPHIETVVSTNS